MYWHRLCTSLPAKRHISGPVWKVCYKMGLSLYIEDSSTYGLDPSVAKWDQSISTETKSKILALKPASKAEILVSWPWPKSPSWDWYQILKTKAKIFLSQPVFWDFCSCWTTDSLASYAACVCTVHTLLRNVENCSAVIFFFLIVLHHCDHL